MAFDWTSTDAAVGWRAQVLEQGDAQRLLLDGRFAGAQARWSDLPDGHYRLRVRGITAEGLEGRHTEHLFRLKARPEPPLLREPGVQQVVVGEQARFAWTPASPAVADAAQQATRYRLQVANSPTFTAPLHDLADVVTPEVSLALPPGNWFWRVATVQTVVAAGAGSPAAAVADTGPWSDPQPFVQQASPPPPPPSAPVAQTRTVDGGRMLLRWAAGSPGSRYQMQVSDQIPFGRVLDDRVLSEPSVHLENLAAGRYLIRLRTIDAGGTTGPWSASNELQVPSTWSWWWLAPAAVLLWLF